MERKSTLQRLPPATARSLCVRSRDAHGSYVSAYPNPPPGPLFPCVLHLQIAKIQSEVVNDLFERMKVSTLGDEEAWNG